MSTSFRIDIERRVVYARTLGETSSEDIVEALAAMQAHPDYRPGMRLLLDMREVKPSLFRSDVVRIAEFVRGHREAIGALKMAVVVPKDTSFGMAQEQKAELYGSLVNMEAFRGLPEALEWLGLSTEEGLLPDVDAVAG